MKLFIDVGNTALKWRRRGGDNIEQGGGTIGGIGKRLCVNPWLRLSL